MTNAEWLDEYARSRDWTANTNPIVTALYDCAAELRAARALADACKPFLSDLELRAAYDVYRLARGEV